MRCPAFSEVFQTSSRSQIIDISIAGYFTVKDKQISFVKRFRIVSTIYTGDENEDYKM